MTNIKTNLRLIVFLACVFVVGFILVALRQEQLLFLVTKIWGQEDEKTVAFSQLLTPEVFLQAKWMTGTLFCCFCLMIYLDPSLFKDYGKAFKILIASVYTEIRSWRGQKSIYFYLLIITGSVLLFAWCFIFPLQLDELHTWMFFVERGSVVVLSYYPGSNNHIAYNLLSLWWNLWLSPLWAIRMVSILSAIGCWVLLAIMVRKVFDGRMAIVGGLLLMTSFHVIWYASQGRGYMLEMFCLFSMSYVMLGLDNERFQSVLLTFFGVWAVYTVPVAIIPVVVLYLFWCWRIKQKGSIPWGNVIRLWVYTTVGIVFCYAPVLIMSGPMAVFHNPYVKHLNRSEWFIDAGSYLFEILSFLSGGDRSWTIAVVLFLFGGSVFMSLSGRQRWILWFFILSIPMGLLTVYPVLLFDRTWLWLVAPLIVWLLEILYFIGEKNAKGGQALAWGIVIAWACCNGWELHKAYVLVKATDDTVLSIQQEIDRHLQGKTLSVEDDALYNHLRYHWLQHPHYDLEYSANSKKKDPDAVLEKRTGKKIGNNILWEDNDYVLYFRHSKL